MSKTDNHYKDLHNAPYDKPCRKCGATQRDENGHDPCIPDLPGVLHACCGHGVQAGYVMFESGIVLRGEFDTEKAERNLKNQILFGVYDV